MRAKTASWILIGFLGVVPVGCGGGGGAGASPAGNVKLSGAIKEPRSWGVDGIATLPNQQTQTVSYLGEGMQKSITGKGVLLLDLLQRAKPKFDAKKKRDMLRYAIYIHATDGYASSLSWGEIDPDFAAKPVLVTYEENGKRLDRPGVLVPGDKHGGRHVYDTDKIELVALGD